MRTDDRSAIDIGARGLCRYEDPELWYAEAEGAEARPDRVVIAKTICGMCPVQDECLAYALRNGEEYGIWGGHTAEERREL